MEWSVSIEIATDPARVDIDALADAFESAAISTTEDSVAVRLWIEASDATKAVAAARKRVTAHVPGVVVGLEVTEWSRFERELERSPMPELVGVAEAEAVLGVSRQRFHQIRSTHASFPAPLTEVAATPLWTRAAIDQFVRGWNRKPGRPAGASGRGTERTA